MKPARRLDPVQSGEERARLHAEGPVRDLLDSSGDSQPVEGTRPDGLEHEQIERALDDFALDVFLFLHDFVFRDIRPSAGCQFLWLAGSWQALAPSSRGRRNLISLGQTIGKIAG